MRKLLKIWNRKRKWQKFKNIYQGRWKLHISDQISDRPANCAIIVWWFLLNMNANQAFCVAIAVLLLQIPGDGGGGGTPRY